MEQLRRMLLGLLKLLLWLEAASIHHGRRLVSRQLKMEKDSHNLKRSASVGADLALGLEAA